MFLLYTPWRMLSRGLGCNKIMHISNGIQPYKQTKLSCGWQHRLLRRFPGKESVLLRHLSRDIFSNTTLCVGSLCPCPNPVLARTVQSLSVFVFGQDVFGRIQAFCGKSNHRHSSFSFAFTPDEALWKFNPSANLRGQGPLLSLEDVRQVSGKGKCSGRLHWSRSGGSSWKLSVYLLLTVCSLYSDHFFMGLK